MDVSAKKKSGGISQRGFLMTGDIGLGKLKKMIRKAVKDISNS